jgi:hypothetical protein
VQHRNGPSVCKADLAREIAERNVRWKSWNKNKKSGEIIEEPDRAANDRDVLICWCSHFNRYG